LVLLENSIRPAPLGLRLESPGAKEKLGFKSEDILARQGSLLAVKNAPANLVEMEKRGEVSRVSFAGQSLLAEACASGLPEPVWDACCGRGGKSFFLTGAGHELWASDTSQRRLKGFVREMKRLGQKATFFAAAAELPPFSGRNRPGSVLLDVPCSGLGVLSRRPDIKLKRTPEEIPGFRRRQKAMLESAARIVRPGGQVLYMTCTLNREENEDLALEAEKGLEGIELVQELKSGLDCPDLGEYFYLARFRKSKLG
ncbi:MAG: Fmu (Sun) domain-containing protein, partial [Desulfonatronovibrionaceae bacterium]